ncbi:MAG: protein-L-isoaspartate O-methyltransferase, partial [Myxococcota bacterium]|nr:protein-L-isoaspartate O-methyltransferase [Myxococcota bacterium]
MSGRDIFSERQKDRNRLIDDFLIPNGIDDERTIQVLRKIPRHYLIEERYQAEAYEDHPVPIGFQQTISQPFIVAFMTQTLALNGTERVLEIGTGSGYQSAILAELCAELYTVEILAFL